MENKKLTKKQRNLIIDCLRIDQTDTEAFLKSKTEHMSNSMRTYREYRLEEVSNIIRILTEAELNID